MQRKYKEIKESLNIEKTVILVKPDGVQRGLVGDIMSRFEKKGLKLVGLKMIRIDEALVVEHYNHLKNRPFFKSLSEFMRSSPIVAMVWEGVDAIDAVRIVCGITNSREADVGTIRGDLSMGRTSNVVHASDSVETANVEIERFFDKDEIFDYEKSEYLHMYLAEL